MSSFLEPECSVETVAQKFVTFVIELSHKFTERLPAVWRALANVELRRTSNLSEAQWNFLSSRFVSAEEKEATQPEGLRLEEEF